MTKSQEMRKYVVGQKIVKVLLNPVRDHDHLIYEPEIYLTNGAVLRFMTQEMVDGGDYGVYPIVVKGDK